MLYHRHHSLQFMVVIIPWRFPAKTGALMQNGFFKSSMLILIHLRALWAMLITFKTRYTWQQFHVEGSRGHITWLVQNRVSPPQNKKERERESAKEDQQIPAAKERDISSQMSVVSSVFFTKKKKTTAPVNRISLKVYMHNFNSELFTKILYLPEFIKGQDIFSTPLS